MRSTHDLAFHLRMAALLIFSLFLEQQARHHLGSWWSPQIGIVTLALGLVWVSLASWQGTRDARERVRALEQRLASLDEVVGALVEDQRRRRALPPR